MAEGRRPITIATLTSLVLAAVVVAEAIAADHGGYNPTFSAKTNDKWVHASPLKQISYLEKAIKVVCSSTDYPETCKRALEMATKGQKAHPKGQKAHPKDHKAHPKDLVKMAIKAAGDEVSAVMKRTEMFKFKSDEEKGALEDCKKLFYDATEELNISASSIVGDVKELTSKSSDLNNWLSAVRSYLETCVDGFPHGKIKADMKKALKTANELTSNSLAIISNLSSLLSTFGIRRHLLAEKPSRALDKDFNRTEAEKFTVGTFLEADWIKAANVPVHIGLSG
ncbi:hypothetical protein SAY87_006974 [Trapa incisa]|uniref:Pectinesterase inhibitor domain-containing protein n=1 Tax=Trapa incisa TaxID=236973 RepID=A0AAN7K238_9MYRT|nr:hypothetical protein SAY87_006974 [Trapa incisa]